MPSKRPNVLWICTDQHRYDALGAAGNDVVETPTLDALANSGVRFDRAYCQSPVCTPSRASMLTGRYPRTTRCRQNGQPIPRRERLVTTHLAEAGYRCALAGKFHLSPTNPDDATDATAREPVRPVDDGYGTAHWSASPGDDAPENEYRQWLRGQGERFDPSPYEGSPYVETSQPTERHHTTWCTDRAIEYVRTAADTDDPWLCSLNYFDPHHPFDPPRASLERYLDREIETPNFDPGELDGKPAVQREAATSGRLEGANLTDDEHRLVRAAYYAMIDHVDDNVARLLNALAETGQREDTFVVFCADHGEMLGDHGIYKKGPYFYEPTVRVPLVVSWPGQVREGRVVDDLVELTDLAPTILDAAGQEHPPGMQGRSLWPLLTGGDTERERPHRESAYCEFYNASKRHTDPPAYATMLRTERYKLVRHHGPEDGELYDLERDPEERVNRWGDPDYTSVQQELVTRLTDRMARTVDPLPERRGHW
ncbi:sulfatase family protein [Halorhabdus amylolytica]|uniref:sulfatase family protein n=1 Tax=Halorhabdus amylolytica TaxID=2559573 RepID=UPI0010AABF0F|nr:sulfatase-like hydrolase/transferase [Halorhabdus amylolytica]